MQIINKVEINYFRSVYSVSLKNISDLNILIGGNDSGKSNILKALNLFFNNETELGQAFFFADDLTRKREQEARDAKGRATIWIKVYFNNFLGWRSLPEEFVIKKVWNRYSAQPETSFPAGVSTTSVVKFLNKLSFHYVPAVRGRDIFTYFLIMLHDALLEYEKEGLVGSTEALMAVINSSTSDMSIKIQDGVGIESNIQPPTDLRVLFNALDFSTNYGNHNIPLQKRGDGIQSRHIPFILDFIARHSKTHHIWAYEEPETSLEMGPAFELARQFNNDFCEENQIFLTTHSPAFYDISSPHSAKWFVYQKLVNDEHETKVEKVTSADLVDSKLGVAALVADRAREAYERIEQLSITVQRLDEEVQANNLPHVIVEGITDKYILEEAFRRLYPNQDIFCEFVHAAGANNIPPYLKSAKVLSKEISHPIIGLFDRDNEGRKQMRNFHDCPILNGTEFLTISSERDLYVGMLPLPTALEGIDSDIKEALGHDINIPIPIEFMFPEDVVNEAINENIITLKDRIARASDPELPAEINLTELFSKHLPETHLYLSKKVQSESKSAFANWIIRKEGDHFTYFKELFDQLEILVEP